MSRTHSALVERITDRLQTAIDQRSDDERRGVLGDARLYGEAASVALNGVDVGTAPGTKQKLYALIVTNLREGMLPGRAVRLACESSGVGQKSKPEKPAEQERRERTVAELTRRYESALASGNDPARAANIAASGLGGGQHGLAPHLAAAAEQGLDPAQAAEAAYAAYHGRGATGFGDALLDRGGNRPTKPKRETVNRSWDDLDFSERLLVTSFQADQGRGGEKPSPRDISDALSAVSR